MDLFFVFLRLSSLLPSHSSEDSLPCSLVMTNVSAGGNRVIAHAQLLSIVGRPQSAYLHDGVLELAVKSVQYLLID